MKRINWYFTLYRYISKVRLERKDLDPRRIHTHIAAVLTTGLLMWSYAILACLTISSPIPGIVGILCSTVHLLSPLLFRITPSAFLVSNIMIGSGMIHQGTFAFYTGGFESFILIWFGILPILAGMIAGRKGALVWACLPSLWALAYLVLHLNGFVFPNLITPQGNLIAQALIIFGYIFLGTTMIYVLLSMNEFQERKLAEQSTRIDDLFRVLFHDLAGPLSRISIGLDIFKREAKATDRTHGLNIAEKAMDSMIEITHNVRKMYAANKGKTPTDLSYCSLADSVEYVQRLYANELNKKNIQLDFDVKKYRGLSIFVEPISFKNQVLGNAFSNAIKFSPPGSKISVRAYCDKLFHVIEIVDHGIGIPESMMGSLFDITKKTSRPGTQGEIGTGFGLHIMKSFMDMYEGKIQVDSREEDNRGTIIRLFLKARWIQEGSPLPE